MSIHAFILDSDQQLGRYGHPYLRLDCVLASANEHHNVQLLLDPFEDALRTPIPAVQVGDQHRLQSEVVGHKYETFFGVVFKCRSAHRCRVIRAGKIGRKHTRLIAKHRLVDPVQWVRVAPSELGIDIGAGNKKCLRLVDHEQACKVQINLVHQIECPRLQNQIIHRVDLVRLNVSDVNEAWDISSKILQCVLFYGSLARTKLRPRKHEIIQIDGPGVEAENRCIEFHSKRFCHTKQSGNANQSLGKVGINWPRSSIVRIGQSIARCIPASTPDFVKPVSLNAKVDLYVTLGLASGQLYQGQGEELVEEREVIGLVFSSVVGHKATTCAQWQIENELRKYEFAFVYKGFGQKSVKAPVSDFRLSCRDQNQTLNSARKSLNYDVLM